MRLLFLFLVFPLAVLSQNIALPFELERFSADKYSELSDNDKPPYTSESQAIRAYINAYKVQRALRPADYFPAPNDIRTEASTYLRTNYGTGGNASLTKFLETNGGLESAAALLSRPSGNDYVLPYRFLAAFLLSRRDLEKEALIEMKQRGMIHPLLLAFGANSLYSAEGSDICITNGLQDLIAVRASQLVNGLHPEIQVYNLFAEQCAGFGGKKVESSIEDPNLRIWVAPTMNPDFLTAFQDQLWSSGIGYVHARGPSPEPDTHIENLLQMARDFQMVDVEVKNLNPSLLGIGRSYGPFGKMLAAYAPLYGSKADRKRSEEIAIYLSQFHNPF